MSRKPATVEHLERLVDWAGGHAAFCRQTGILPPNLCAYLGGTKSISWERLRRANEHVFGCPPAFLPVIEGYDLRANGFPSPRTLPQTAGLYALYDSAMRLLYCGKAKSLRTEVNQTLRRCAKGIKTWPGQGSPRFGDLAAYLSAYRIVRGDRTFLHDAEALVLHLAVNNTLNTNKGHFKRIG